MGLFDQFPYTNFHELNLDWILKALKELEQKIDQFVANNTLTYADPIQWDITKQYEKNTIVLDPNTDIAYISVAAVPTGIALSNTDYWMSVFDVSELIQGSIQNLTENVEGAGVVYSTFDLNPADWIIWNGILYEALTTIPTGTAYVVDTNIKRVTVEEFIKNINAMITNMIAEIGDLNDLTTTNKDNIVSAINEINTGINAAYIPYITGDFVDVPIGDYIKVNGYNSEYDGGEGIYEHVSTAISGITYDHAGQYYKPVPENGFVNVKLFGVIGGVNTEPEITNNRNIIDGVIAAGEYNGLIIPADVNYGYNSHVDNLVQLNTIVSPIKLVIKDYSVDNSYNADEARGAAIERMIFATPNNTGQNDGNGLIVTGANHPYISIINDNERSESQRASILFGSRDSGATGVYNWQISQCYFAQDKVLSIVKYYYDEDLQMRTSHCFIAMDYDTHNMAIGYGTPKFGLQLQEVFPTIVGTTNGTIFHYLDKHTGWTKRLDFNYDNDTLSFSDLNNKRLEYTIPTGLIRHTNPSESVNQIIQLAPNSTGNALAVRNYASQNEVFTINNVGSGKFRLGVSGGAFTTANRPSGVETGAMIFDTTLHKPVWYDGSSWRDATGAIV